MKLILNVCGLSLAAGLASSIVLDASSGARAQPAPSFRSTCGDLRTALQTFDLKDDELVTIEVVGALTTVHFDGVLAYLVMGAPPDPQVLCVTYGTNGRTKGDVAVISGAYSRRGPDHIQLDPCLHFQPDEDGSEQK